MEVLDGRRAAAVRLMDAYGEQAPCQAAVYVSRALANGRNSDALYWDQVRRMVEQMSGELSTKRGTAQL